MVLMPSPAYTWSIVHNCTQSISASLVDVNSQVYYVSSLNFNFNLWALKNFVSLQNLSRQQTTDKIGQFFFVTIRTNSGISYKNWPIFYNRFLRSFVIGFTV